MSTFLQRLALRESGAVPVLQPRLPSWFEPAAGRTPGAAPEIVDEAREETVDRVAPAPGRPAQRNHAEPRQPATPPVRVPIAGPAPASRPLAALVAPAPRMTIPETKAQETTRLPAILAPLAAAPAPAEPAPARARPAQARQLVIQETGPLPARRNESAAPPLPLAATQAAPASAPPARAKAALQAPPTPPLAPPSVRMAPAALLAVQAAEGRRSADAAAPEPVVQVTIGRLEVRAVQSAQAPAPPRPRQAPTSLDDYLAKRNGEQRR